MVWFTVVCLTFSQLHRYRNSSWLKDRSRLNLYLCISQHVWYVMMACRLTRAINKWTDSKCLHPESYDWIDRSDGSHAVAFRPMNDCQYHQKPVLGIIIMKFWSLFSHSYSFEGSLLSWHDLCRDIVPSTIFSQFEHCLRHNQQMPSFHTRQKSCLLWGNWQRSLHSVVIQKN